VRCRAADCGAPVAGRDQLQDPRVERFGEDDWLGTELDPHLVIAGVDMAEGEAADRGPPLGVMQDEQSGGAISRKGSGPRVSCRHMPSLGLRTT
jgi:hypothetical protein